MAPEPDENRGFPVRGFRRVRSENASGILVTREAAGAEAPFCRISCRSGRAAYPTEDTRRPEAGKRRSGWIPYYAEDTRRPEAGKRRSGWIPYYAEDTRRPEAGKVKALRLQSF